MKIPSKIDKRTHTRLTKKNMTYLLGEIADQNHDLLLEAKYIALVDCTNKYMVASGNAYKDTCNEYNKSVKKAFKDYKSDKMKLDKAYAKYCSSKK